MTEKYHESDPMGDVISDDCRMLQMMSRFGIKLGFGDQTVAATCSGAGVDVGTFLTVVNYLKDPARARLGEMAECISLPALMKYLRNSHAYFIGFRLPAIRRKLIGAIDCSAHNRMGLLVLKCYDEFAAEVVHHMDYEDTHVHPYVECLLARRLPTASFASLADRLTDNHSGIGRSIAELKSIIVKYYPSDNNATLLNDVLMDIYMTEEDLLEHCRLEDSLFAECVRRLEERVRQSAYDVAINEEEGLAVEGAAADGLGEREKEVVAYVAKGLSNKEIAEQMFISVNTVMTHRRNISRKLNVRSAAGLTIYAIVNGLISLEDVRA